MEYSQQQLVIAREVKFRAGEAAALGNIGIGYHFLGNYAEAIEYQEQSLVTARENKDDFSERLMLHYLGLTYSKQEPQLAISFYRQAINVSEKIRSNIKNLSADVQASYTQSVLETTPVKVTVCTTVDLQGFQRSPSKINDPELA